MKKTKSKLEWFKKNIVIVPVVAAIIAGTFTSVRYVLSLTDTITANQETILKMESKLTSATADINDLKQRLSAAEANLRPSSTISPNNWYKTELGSL